MWEKRLNFPISIEAAGKQGEPRRRRRILASFLSPITIAADYPLKFFPTLSSPHLAFSYPRLSKFMTALFSRVFHNMASSTQKPPTHPALQ